MSGESFYLLCLNLAVRVRYSASAERFITLVYTAVKNSAIFDLVQEDIVKGMTSASLIMLPTELYPNIVGSGQLYKRQHNNQFHS